MRPDHPHRVAPNVVRDLPLAELEARERGLRLPLPHTIVRGAHGLILPLLQLRPRVEARLHRVQRVARVVHELVQRSLEAGVLELRGEPKELLDEVDVEEGVAPLHAVRPADVFLLAQVAPHRLAVESRPGEELLQVGWKFPTERALGRFAFVVSVNLIDAHAGEVDLDPKRTRELADVRDPNRARVVAKVLRLPMHALQVRRVVVRLGVLEQPLLGVRVRRLAQPNHVRRAVPRVREALVYNVFVLWPDDRKEVVRHRGLGERERDDAAVVSTAQPNEDAVEQPSGAPRHRERERGVPVRERRLVLPRIKREDGKAAQQREGGEVAHLDLICVQLAQPAARAEAGKRAGVRRHREAARLGLGRPERLRPKRIRAQQNRPLRQVHDDDRKLTTKLLHEGLAVLRVHREQHLPVRRRRARDAEFAVVVDFTIEQRHDALVGAHEGLHVHRARHVQEIVDERDVADANVVRFIRPPHLEVEVDVRQRRGRDHI